MKFYKPSYVNVLLAIDNSPNLNLLEIVKANNLNYAYAFKVNKKFMLLGLTYRTGKKRNAGIRLTDKGVNLVKHLKKVYEVLEDGKEEISGQEVSTAIHETPQEIDNTNRDSNNTEDRTQ